MFDCAWCKEYGFKAPDYRYEGDPAARDDQGKPICEFCADKYRAACDTQGESNEMP